MRSGGKPLQMKAAGREGNQSDAAEAASTLKAKFNRGESQHF